MGMRKTLIFILSVITMALFGCTVANAGTGFTVNGHLLLRDGQPWTPYGFTLSTFQNGAPSIAKNEYATVAAQLRAIKNPWHGNTVRLQIEQDEYLYGGDHVGAQVFRDKVNAVIRLAEQDGLVVVINDQTEGGDGIYTKHEPLPTAATLSFWKDMETYKNDPDVILDPFNEPRYYPAGSTAVQQWNWWHNGDGIYVGAVTVIRDLRSDGFTNQLWMEAPGNAALAELVQHPGTYRLPDTDTVYEFHHTAVPQDQDPTVGEWASQFGDLVTQDNMPVVDGEWTNRSLPAAVYGTAKVYEPSGDMVECWGDAPVAVPKYLAYLRSLGVGMTVWTLGPDPDLPSVDYINADGDTSSFSTANNYDNWQGCLTPAGGVIQGAGQDIMNWFNGSA